MLAGPVRVRPRSRGRLAWARGEVASRCMPAITAASGRGLASSMAWMRRKRQSPGQSRPRKAGPSGGATRLLALTSRPDSGAVRWGNWSKGIKPCQSWLASWPGAGMAPSPARRTGMRPVMNMAMPPARSATIRFCEGLVMRAAASPAAARVVARLSISRPSAALSWGARLAMDTARAVPLRGRLSSRSEMTGPWRVSRMRSTCGGAPRTRMSSSRVVKGRGPSSVA